jgi:hypothetical protein
MSAAGATRSCADGLALPPSLIVTFCKNIERTTPMHVSYVEAVMAFFGLASIVIGSFAERITEHVLREPQASSAQRLRRQSQ